MIHIVLSLFKHFMRYHFHMKRIEDIDPIIEKGPKLNKECLACLPLMVHQIFHAYKIS